MFDERDHQDMIQQVFKSKRLNRKNKRSKKEEEEEKGEEEEEEVEEEEEEVVFWEVISFIRHY